MRRLPLRPIRVGLACLVFLFGVWSLAGAPAAMPTEQANREWVERTLKTMTLDEKVGQLLVPALTTEFMNEASPKFQEIKRNITVYHVGGYHAYGGDPAALALLVNRMQALAQVPLLITADLEGGPGYEFPGATRLPRAMALAATGSEDLVYQAGKITALEGRAMGIGVNFYPVVDVNNNPRNPIINIRSFGEDVATVSRLGAAYVRGLQENGMIATAKHFPGHGDTSQDSHLELAAIDVSRERLEQVELPPFRAAVAAGVGAVMTGHILLPQIEREPGLPATLSPAITTGLLRKELGFQGLVFTDAMTMKGLTKHFSGGEATVRAVEAGADMILYPVDVKESFEALKRAVKSGEISQARLDESVRRILAAKARLDLPQHARVDVDALARLAGSTEHQELARTMMERALTLVRDERHVLPLTLTPDQHVLLVNLVDSNQDWREGVPGEAFEEELRRRHERTIEVKIDDRTAKDAIEVVEKLAATSDVVLVNGFVRVAAYSGSLGLTQGQVDLLKSLVKTDKPFVFILFGSPYLLSFAPDLPSYVLTYEYYPEAERAAVRALFGEIPFQGTLPVSLTGAYPVGFGLKTETRPASGASGSD